MTSSSCGIAPVLVLFEGADPPFIRVSDKSMIVRMKKEWFEVDRTLGGTTWFPHVFLQQLFPGIPRHHANSQNVRDHSTAARPSQLRLINAPLEMTAGGPETQWSSYREHHHVPASPRAHSSCTERGNYRGRIVSSHLLIPGSD